MSEIYKPGTKRGQGIAFERENDWMVQEKKEKIAEIIQQKMKEKGYSLRELERKTNVYHNQIHHIIQGHTNYKIETLLRLLIALDLDIFGEETNKS